MSYLYTSPHASHRHAEEDMKQQHGISCIVLVQAQEFSSQNISPRILTSVMQNRALRLIVPRSPSSGSGNSVGYRNGSKSDKRKIVKVRAST